MTEMKTTRRTWLRGLAAAGLILATPKLMAEDTKDATVSTETAKETEKVTTSKETEKETSKETEKETSKESEKDTERESDRDSEKESCDSGASAAPELASYPMLILSGTAIVSFILGRQVGARKKS